MMEHANEEQLRQIAMGALKGLMATLPLGSSLIRAWDGYQSSRLDDTMQQLSAKIKKIGEEKVDIEYAKSEEFMDLFQKALRTRLRSRSAQKAKIILGLLAESLRKNRSEDYSTDLKETFLSVLDELSEAEMLFLFAFSQGKFSKKSKADIYGIGVSEGRVVDILLAKGILVEENTFDEYLVASMFGREFIAYLELLAQEDL